MVQKAVLSAPMPSHTGDLIAEKMKALSESLDRILVHLEICAGKKEGSSALAQIELVEEIAYSYLFYDVFSVLEKELERSVSLENREQEKWTRFLKLAKCYQKVLSDRP